MVNPGTADNACMANSVSERVWPPIAFIVAEIAPCDRAVVVRK